MLDKIFDCVDNFMEHNVLYYFDSYPKKIKKDKPWTAALLSSLMIIVFPIYLLVRMLSLFLPMAFVLGLFVTVIGGAYLLCGALVGLTLGIMVSLAICVVYNKMKDKND